MSGSNAKRFEGIKAETENLNTNLRTQMRSISTTSTCNRTRGHDT